MLSILPQEVLSVGRMEVTLEDTTKIFLVADLVAVQPTELMVEVLEV